VSDLFEGIDPWRSSWTISRKKVVVILQKKQIEHNQGRKEVNQGQIEGQSEGQSEGNEGQIEGQIEGNKSQIEGNKGNESGIEGNEGIKGQIEGSEGRIEVNESRNVWPSLRAKRAERARLTKDGHDLDLRALRKQVIESKFATRLVVQAFSASRRLLMSLFIHPARAAAGRG
jgi:hypothetical protein